jgi:CheY-like chemotaxis protein
MNTLLIHNDNLPQGVMDIFGDKKLKFDIQSSHVIEQDFTFDKYASAELGNVLTGQQFDAIYVVINLNKNDYLEFTGLSIANHIRLSHEWNHSRTPIVLLSPINLETVSRVADNFEVLYTPGILFETNFTSEAIEKIHHFIKSKFRVDNFNLLTEEDYQKYLFDIKIQPPGHFDSQHSIDNELTLYHWSKSIGIENVELQNELETGLYFKLIKTKNPFEEIDTQKKIKIDENGRVLLIDDQWDKGWVEFYKQFFKSPDKEFSYVEINKGNDYNCIQNAVVERINSFDPDVILLDLRLIDNDFKKNTLIEELSGYLILEFLNSNFPGIQVIITTASSKASTFEKTNRWAHSYIQKTLNFGIQEVIDKIFFNLNSSIKIAKQIKGFILLVKEIKTVLNSGDFEGKFKENVTSHLELAFEIFILYLKSNQQRYIELTFLELYFIVEDFCQNSNIFNEDVFCTVYADQNEYCVVKDYKKGKDSIPAQGKQTLIFRNGHYIKGESRVSRNLDTNFKVSAIMLYRYGLDTSGEKKWSQLNKLRNTDAGHAKNIKGDTNINSSISEIKQENLIELLSLILYFLDDSNISKERVIGSFEDGDSEKTKLLMEKFNSSIKKSKK